MAAARYRRQTIDVAAKGAHAYLLRAGATTLVFPGYLAVYGASADEPEEARQAGEDADELEAANPRLPAVRDGEPLGLDGLEPAQHFTQPPPRYSEPMLIRELERAGVGRPSTYATIVGTIQDRGYVERDGKVFVPTELGFVVSDFVVSFFPTVADLGFTAELEDGLDAVARGERGWQELLGAFYRPFRGALDVASRAAATKVTVEAKPASASRGRGTGVRRASGRGRPKAPPDPLTKRVVARGSKRPTAEAPAEKPSAPVGELCPLCGRDMMKRTGPYGDFLGCVGFPACRGTIKLERPKAAPRRRAPAKRRASTARRRPAS
jgi:DNA topoisomerase-1